MEGIKTETLATKELTNEEQLAAAESMADWFAPFMYGVEIETGEVSELVKARMTEIVGAHPTDEQLRLTREVVKKLPDAHKNNAILYSVGYPQDALSVLADGDVDLTISSMLSIGAMYRPVTELPKVEEIIDEAVPAPAKPGRRPRDFRKDLVEAGITPEQARDRLTAYLDSIDEGRGALAQNAADRFMRWYNGEYDVSAFAASEGASTLATKQSLKYMLDIVLATKYESLSHDASPILVKRVSGISSGDSRHVGTLSSIFRPSDRTRSYEHVPADAPENKLAWQALSLCAETDPEAFFPEKGGSTRGAKKICAVCDVAAQCLAYALENDERFGIWGGKSERERRKMDRRSAAAAAEREVARQSA
jgi:WhiB family redox-sensing transcriptional regulator